MRKAILPFLLAFGALSSCKNSANQAVRADEFYIRYLADEQKTIGEATFKKGPDAAQLVPQLMQEVFFQDGAMSERAVEKFIRYRSERPGGFDRRYEFRWKDEQGATQRRTVSMEPILDFELPQPMPKSGSALLKWSGGPLREGETLAVICSNQTTGQTVSYEFEGPTELSAAALDVSKLSAGAWSISLAKTKLQTERNGAATSRALIEFYTAPKAFEL